MRDLKGHYGLKLPGFPESATALDNLRMRFNYRSLGLQSLEHVPTYLFYLQIVSIYLRNLKKMWTYLVGIFFGLSAARGENIMTTRAFVIPIGPELFGIKGNYRIFEN